MRKMREIYRRGLFDALKSGGAGEVGKLCIRKIASLPNNLDRNLFIEAALSSGFMLYHNLRSAETFLISSDEEMPGRLETALPGIKFSERGDGVPDTNKELLCLTVFETNEEGNALDNMYRVLGGLQTSIIVSFMPAGRDQLMRAKKRTEEMLSAKETALTKSLSERGAVASETATTHRDLYYESEEKNFLERALDGINRALLANGSAYKLMVIIEADAVQAHAYVRSRLLILDEEKMVVDNLEDLYRKVERMDAMFLDSGTASRLLCFSNRIKTLATVSGSLEASSGSVIVGNYLEGSVKETDREVRIAPSSLNLGTLISGVPGTGKSFAAMHMLRQLVGKEKVPAIVISPTDEWVGFGRENGLHVIRLHESKVRFNFFRCDSGIRIERFYENLAMLLATASDAGPYTASLEKCMLAAFRKVYASTRSPDPVEVYDEIEEVIIEQHGKRGGAGVKYTKHGENTRAALENLRSMLNIPEFSKQEGVDFQELLQTGCVFDLSLASNKMKPFFYAMILNQVYGFTDRLDSEGDDSLRLLICLEEAQLVFNAERRSAASADLAQRIQDFRKEGVGLILIAHSTTDIGPEIRRLCQTKLYFRQSVDVAKYAASDLLFGEEQRDALVEKLKELSQRTCALNYIENGNGEKRQAGSLFVRLPVCKFSAASGGRAALIENPDLVKAETGILVLDAQGKPREGARLQLFYVGEKVYEGATDKEGFARVGNTIKGNRYTLVVLAERKRDNRRFAVKGGQLNVVEA